MQAEHTGMEIERRWRLAKLPAEDDLAACGAVYLGEVEMQQCYLCCAPVVRLRRRRFADGRADYILCVKGRGTLARQEWETPLTPEVWQGMAALCQGAPITKRTRMYRFKDGRTLECSSVDESLPTAFCYAEVEFETVAQAKAFLPPPFLGEEKTEDASFSMSAYWRATRAAAAGAGEEP